jgi:hypothetical protein
LPRSAALAFAPILMLTAAAITKCFNFILYFSLENYLKLLY